MTREALTPEGIDLLDVDEIRHAAEPRTPDDYRGTMNNVGMEETLLGELAAAAGVTR